MRLEDFILLEMESILVCWEEFARNVETPMPSMDKKGLRNHAEYILKTVAADMRTTQTEQQQIDKSHGLGSKSDGQSPAETHAMTRLVAGFSMDQMVSEYRALRSSVLRLWLAQESSNSHRHVQQIIRFNESIDQALAESISTYGQAVETTRQTMLGILGHDLRTPLAAVTIAGELLQKTEYLPPKESKLVGQLRSSVGRANALVSDLLDLARCNFGTGIPVCLEAVLLPEVCKATVEELRTGHPEVEIEYEAPHTIAGQFDPARMAQTFSNLINNAIHHGSHKHPVRVSLTRHADRALFSVQNFGAVIPAEVVPSLFTAGERYSTSDNASEGQNAGLGLGLFIASQIVAGHDGEIEVESSLQDGTTFRVWLPIR